VKVKIGDIPEEGLDLVERLDPAKLDLDTPDIHFLGGVDVTAHFQKQRGTVWVQVAAVGEQQQICGRCLSAYGCHYHEEFSLSYSIAGMVELDITDDIRQEILLSYPVKLLCREDCRGLCPRCGENLNERVCDHGIA